MTNLAAIPMPVQNVRPVRTKRGRTILLTPQEMLDLLKAARKRSTRDRTMILLAYRHVLRASEVCGIKLADVETAAVATSRAAVARRDGCLRARLRKPRADGSDYLFTHQKGASSSFATFRQLPQALASRSRSAISRVLKHSLAAHLVAGNANLALIRQALGHRPIYTAYLILVGTLFCLGSRPHGAVLAGLVGAGRNITSGIASSPCCVIWNQ